jgi:triacylglycerol lipase
MPELNTMGLLALGSLVGVAVGALPNRWGAGPHAIALNPRMRALNMGAMYISAGLAFVLIYFTGLEFHWLPFFAAALGVGAAAMLLSTSILDGGRLFPGATEPLRRFYRNESYRYEKYEPSHGPFIEQFDAHAPPDAASTILVCAHLSRWAYRSASEIALQRWPVPALFIEHENHAGMLVTTPTAAILAFRGTDDLEDWATNLSLWFRRPWGESWGAVHAGFLTAVESLWGQLARSVQSLSQTRMPIWITGHSLGGALAVLTAAKLANEHPKVIIGGVCTFGQPRVGNAKFAQRIKAHLGDRLMRFECTRDPVPEQPPGGIPCGRLMYFNREGQLVVEPAFMQRWWDELRYQPIGIVGDHLMGHYLRLVDSHFAQP